MSISVYCRIKVTRVSDSVLVYDNDPSGSVTSGYAYDPQLNSRQLAIPAGILVDETQYQATVAEVPAGINGEALPGQTYYYSVAPDGVSESGLTTLTPTVSWNAATSPWLVTGQVNWPVVWSPTSAPATFTVSLVVVPSAAQSLPAVAANVPTVTPTFVYQYSNSKSQPTFTAHQLEVRRVSDLVMMWQPGQLATLSGEQSSKQVSKLYAGTALANNIAYQWRVRVQSSQGQWSPYTGWRNFTPVLTPAMPSNIAPNGLVNTLTPAVTGTYNQGTGLAEQQFEYLIQYPGGVAVYDSGAVTGTIAVGQLYGTSNAGGIPAPVPPALTWATAYQISARSKDTGGAWSAYSAWLDFHTNAAPTTPSYVQPNGSTTPNTTPTITWQHNDPDGDAQTAVDIELYDQTALAYVAGYGPKTLAQAGLSHVVTAPLTLTHTYQLRVRTAGLAGPSYSPWSNPVTFTVATAPTVAITAPTTGQVLAQSTLPVTWTFAGGSGVKQDHRVLVFDNDAATILYDSGVLAGVQLTYTIPPGTLVNNHAYFVQAIIRDTLSQSASTSKVPFTTVWPPPAPVTGLFAVPVGSQL